MRRWFWLDFVVLFLLVNPEARAQEKTPTGFYYPTGTREIGNSPGFLSVPPQYLLGLYHLGQDIKVKEGALVYAIADGQLTRISKDESGWGKGNLGLIVRHRLDDGASFYAVYGHVLSALNEGTTVVVGQVIAIIGPYSGGSHLHFGIYPGEAAPSSPLGRWYLPKDWKPGDLLDSKGFVEPIKWIEEKHPSSYQPSPPISQPIVPVISGDKILYAEESQGSYRTWLINPDGTESTSYLDLGRFGIVSCQTICMSSDGQELIFAKEDKAAGCNAIYSLSLRDGKLTRLIPKQSEQIIIRNDNQEKRWRYYDYFSPDTSFGGPLIVFERRLQEDHRTSSGSGGGGFVSSEIWTMDGQGNYAGVLSGLENISATDPFWLADGRICYAIGRDLFLYDSLEQSSICLPFNAQNALNFRWSGLVDKIAFLSYEKEPWNILCLLNPNGQNRKVLFSPNRYIVDFDWSRDDSKIVAIVRTAPSTPLIYGAWEETDDPKEPYRAVLDEKYEYQLVVIDVKSLRQNTIMTVSGRHLRWVRWNSFHPFQG